MRFSFAADVERIQTATERMRTLLVDAVARGVDVRILVPGSLNDVPTTRWAGQHFFEELLQGGVRIFVHEGAMMHAKTLVVDGVWGTVGSMNLDNRSMRLNEEWTLVFHDPAVGATLDRWFLEDLGRSKELSLEEHRQRPIAHKIRERLASLLAPLL